MRSLRLYLLPNVAFVPRIRVAVFRVYLSFSRAPLPTPTHLLLRLVFSFRFALKRDSIHSEFLSSNSIPWTIPVRKGAVKRFPTRGPRSRCSGYFKQLLSALPATTKTRLHGYVSTPMIHRRFTRLPSGLRVPPRLARSLARSRARAFGYDTRVVFVSSLSFIVRFGSTPVWPKPLRGR